MNTGVRVAVLQRKRAQIQRSWCWFVLYTHLISSSLKMFIHFQNTLGRNFCWEAFNLIIAAFFYSTTVQCNTIESSISELPVRLISFPFLSTIVHDGELVCLGRLTQDTNLSGLVVCFPHKEGKQGKGEWMHRTRNTGVYAP